MYRFFTKYGAELEYKEELTQADIDEINAKNIGFTMQNRPEYKEFYNAAVRFYKAMEEAKARGNIEELKAMQDFMQRNLKVFIEDKKEEFEDNNNNNSTP